MRRHGRWLVTYPGVYGEVRVAREFDDYDEAEGYASELASLIRGVKLIANPAKVVEVLVTWRAEGAVQWSIELWECAMAGVSGEKAGRKAL
ncbi:MAG TPA: hypothetical protein VIK75_09735 [Calditerricola sp.]